MKNFFKNLFVTTIPTLIVMVLLLELIFRFLIVATDTPNYVFDSDYEILKYEANTDGYNTVGRFPKEKFHWTINNVGWNSPIDYSQDKQIGKKRLAVIGDSYIESFLTNSDEAYSRVLDTELSDYEIYSFGISGAPLSQYLHMARYVEDKYDPDSYVINIVHNDFDESVNGYFANDRFMTVKVGDSGVSGEIKPTAYQTSNTKKTLKYSAIARYLIKNLNLTSFSFGGGNSNTKDSVEVNANIVVSEVKKREDKVFIAVDYAVSKFASEFKGKEVLFVIDGPRHDIYEGKLENSSVMFMNRMIWKACEKYDLPYIDLTKYQNDAYMANQQKFNSEEDFHWDAYGHQFVANILKEHYNR